MNYDRPDLTSPGAIAGAVIVFVLFVVFMPFLAIFIPIAFPILIALYFMSHRAETKARSAAKKKMWGAQSTLDVEANGLALNDYGVFYGAFGRRTREMSWDEITSVSEPAIGLLEFRGSNRTAITVDLNQDRYFEVIWAVHSMIPDRTEFLIDPLTGELTLLRQLRRRPMAFRGRWGTLVFTDGTLQHNGVAISWPGITSVSEAYFPGRENETNPYWVLTVRSPRHSFELWSSSFSEPMLWHTDYDLIKCVIAQKLPDRVNFHRPIPTGRERAREEFNRCREATRGAFSMALKTGVFVPCEKYFRHMTMLIDRFDLDRTCDTLSLYQDYAELLNRTGRPREAAGMHARARNAAQGS